MRSLAIMLAVITGLTLSLPIWAQEAPTTAPSSATAPAAAEPAAPAQDALPAAPAAGPVSAPATQAAVAAPACDDLKSIVFQFEGVPFAHVVRKFAQLSGKPVLGDISIDGTLTFFDSQPYTYEEAFDTLNILLGMRGYELREDGRFLRLMTAVQVPPMASFFRNADAIGPQIRPSETVTVMLPLKYLDSDSASKAVVRLLSPGGFVAPLIKGRGIMLTDRLETIKRVRMVLNELDTETIGAERQIKMVQLKHASARTVATIVTELFGRGRPTIARRWPQPGAPQPQPQQDDEGLTVTADERTNMVLLVGPGDKIAVAEKLIEELDQVKSDPLSDIRVFKLQSAKAESVANTIRSVVSSGQVPQPQQPNQPQPPRPTGRLQTGVIRVVADAATNRLVVSAPVDQMPAIEALVRELDAACEEVGSATVCQLAHADAQQLSSIIANAVNRSVSAGQRGAAAAASISVGADARSNSLILSGPAGDIQTALKLIAELDRPIEELKLARESHVIQLKAGDARQIATSLVRLFAQQAPGGPRGAGATATNLKVEADPNTNSLMISAAPGDWPIIRDILEKLEASFTQGATAVTKFIPVQNAKASEIAATLRQVYDRRGASGRPGDSKPVPVVITSSDNSNSLLISASENDHAILGELIAQLDVTPTEKATEPIRMKEVKAADPEKLAATLRALIPSRSRSGGQDILIQADPVAKMLLIRAPEAEWLMLEKLIGELDKGLELVAREMRMIELKHVSAGSLVPMLSQLYRPASSRSRPTAGRGQAAGGTADDEVIITAAPGDRALVVDAPKNKVDEIAGLAASLDSETTPGRLEIRTYLLPNSNAADVAQSLARLFAEQKGRTAAATTNAEPQPKFEADAATNNLIVAATMAQFVEIEKLIDKLKVELVKASTTRTFALAHAKAEDVAPLLGTMLADGAAPRAAGPNRRAAGPSADQATRVAALGNTIVVQGLPEKVALAEELIKVFDTPEKSGAPVVEVVKLDNADPVSLAQAVSQNLAVAAKGGTRAPSAAQPIAITPEVNSGSILVRGPADDVQAIVAMIKGLDKEGTATSTLTKVYQLKCIKGDEIAGLLQTMLADSARAAAARRTASPARQEGQVKVAAMGDAVVVQGTPDKHALAEELIKAYDVEGPGRPVVEIVQLANAEPVSLASSVNQMLAGKTAKGPGAVATTAVTVTAETNSASILVRGAADEVASVVAMIRQLDAGGIDASVQVRVIRLANSEATDLAKSINSMFQEIVRQAKTAKGTAKAPVFSVTADAKTNSLVVSTTPAYHAMVSALLEELEKKPETPSRDVRYVQLVNADAWDVAYKLDSLYRDRRPAERPVIEADSLSNMVSIIGKTADIDEIEQVIGKMDAATSAQIRVIPMTSMRAEKMAQMLQRLYGPMTDSPVIIRQNLQPQPADLFAPSHSPFDHEGATMPAEWLEDLAPPASAPAAANESPVPQRTPVVIAVDKDANALMVSASRQDLANIQALINKFATAPSASESEFRVYAVKQADPGSVAKALEQLFNPKPIVIQGGQQPGGRGQQQRNQQQQPQQQRGGEDAQQVKPQQPVITVVADLGTRSLIVRAKATDHELIEPLIAHLDQRPSLVSEMRVFPLKNAEASEVAANIRELFNIARLVATQGAAAQRGQNPQQQRAEMVRQFFELRREEGDASQVEASTMINVTHNSQSNSIIATAPADAMELIQRLIQELDQSAALATAVVRTYPIKNADVASVVTALREVFTRTAQAGPAAPAARGAGGARRLSAQQGGVVVAADEQAKLVIVSAPEEMHKLIGELVQEIDSARTTGETLIRVYRVQNADAASVAAALSSALAEGSSAVAAGGRRGGGATTPVAAPAGGLRISADRSSNCIVVRATQEEHDKISALLADMDIAPAEQYPVRAIALKNADPETVAAALRSLFAAGGAGGGRTGRQAGATASAAPAAGAVAITADRDSRMLLVRADEQTFQKIQELASLLDESNSGQATRKLFQLKHAQAVSVAAAIGASFGQGGARGQRTGPAGTEEVTAVAETGSNSVIVTARPETMEKIQSLLEVIDTETNSGLRTEFVVLRNARAADLAGALQKIASGMVKGTTGGGRGAAAAPSGGLVVSADAGSNAIIMSGPAADVDKLKAIALQLDEQSSSAQLATHVITLKSGDAVSVAGMIRDLYNQQKQLAGKSQPVDALAVSADERSNSLVLACGKDMYEQVLVWVQQLEQTAAVRGGDQVRVIVLKNADPDAVAATLGRLFAGASAARAAAARGARTASVAPAAGGVVIESNRDSRMLMVRADDDTFAKIQELAVRMDETYATVRICPTLIQLKHAQAASLAASVQQAFAPVRGQTLRPEDMVTCVADNGVNCLIVATNSDRLREVQALVAELDTEIIAGVKTDFVILRNARAAELAATLQKVATNATAKPAAKGALPGAQVVVAAAAEANALVISGPAVEVDKLRATALEIDDRSISTVPQTYVVKLANSDAAFMAAMIRDLYSQQKAASKGQVIDPLAVSADDRAGAIVLSTTPEMYERVSAWVDQIEKMKPSKPNLRIITLEHADPTEVEKAIHQLFGQQPPAGSSAPRTGSSGSSSGTSSTPRQGAPTRTPTRGSRGSDKIETSVMPQQRSLLITASDEDFEEIARLVRMLDEQAAKARRQVRIFTLKNANSMQLADSLNNMYRAAASRPGARPEDAVAVNALPQTSAIVVSASQEKMDEVAELIDQLDQEVVAPQLDIRIYPLANATPSKILPMLKQLLADVAKARPGETIAVQADDRTRSVVVTARGALFEKVQELIAKLDQAPTFEKADVLIIPLKRADATALANVLNEMLRPSAVQQVTPEARALQEQVRLLRVRSTVKDDIPELDLSQPIKVSADPVKPGGSNSLVIQSTPDNLKALRAIVEILDSVPITEGVVVRVLHLKNADAASVQTILRDMFTQGRTLAGKPGTTVAGVAEPASVTGKGLTNPPAVAADARTNSLVISGLEETVALAEAIVQDLDRNEGKLVTEVRAFRLKNADAAKLAPLLSAVFAETAAAVPGAEGIRTQVTRLQTVLDRDSGHATVQPKARAALTIQADASTNILLVAARNDVMPLIADVIDTMDIPGAGSLNHVRIFPLINADASRLQAVLASLYAGPNARLIRDEDKPTVAVDTRTNALIVSASDKAFAMIETLIKSLDMKMPVELRDIRLVELKNADASAVAATLQKMVDARVQRLATLGSKDAEALRMIVLADVRSNYLIVGGSAEGFDLVKSLAEQLDGTSPALGGQIQIFPLKEGNAGAIGATLTNLFTQRYSAARTTDVARQRPIILADVRTNSLLVAANADDTKVLRDLLEKLDVPLDLASVQLVVIPLKHNDAGVVGPTINNIFAARLTSMALPGQTPSPQDRVNVVVDSLTNSLIVSASKENLGLIENLLAKVDVEPPVHSGIIKIYQLKHAEPSRVASLLGNLVSQGLYKPGAIAAAGARQTVSAQDKIAITADERTAALIVSASKENLAVIEEIIRQVDTDVDLTSGDIRIYPLKKADATRLAPVLQQFFASKRSAELAVNTGVKLMAIVVVADARTNTLMVAGGKENFAAVEDMLKELDSDSVMPLTNFQIFQLKQATATMIQPTLQTLLNQRITRPGVTKDPVTVLADPRSNSLLVGASPEDMAAAEALIAKLDEVPDAGKTLHIFPLTKGDAAMAAKMLQGLFLGPDGKPAVTISVDERTNSLIISAGDGDLKRLQELVAEIDKDTVVNITEIRVFPLANAHAAEAAQILTNTLTVKPKPMTAASPNRDVMLQHVIRTEVGEELMVKALQEGVLITPDARTNALVVSAPIDYMPLIAALIRTLDSNNPPAAEIRVFKLNNADCRTMATVLSQLFRLTGGNNKAIRYTLTAGEPAGGNPGGDSSATIGSSQQNALTVTVDARTNSLLIGGTRQYVELAGKVIDQLDASEAQERITKIYHLRNVRAADVQTAMQTFLTQERQRLTATLGNDAVGAAERLLEREVTCVAVANEGQMPLSNTLLLSASPRYFQTVMEIVQQLDQPVPQVLIQVLLAEVTLDDSCELGFEWNLTSNCDSKTVKLGTDFGVKGRSDGFTLSVTGGDLSFFLRALQSQGKVEVLSRPQIMAADNQPALVNIGQQVPFIRDSRITESGTTINTIEYRNVGIILNVVPHINCDGFVKMVVTQEKSFVSNSSIPISTGVNAKIINTMEARSTVTVKDGHTIIIGGLITVNDDVQESKVPILGDIPLLGLLFKSSSVQKQRRELLIILTPKIVHNSIDADAVSADQLKRLNRMRFAKPELIHEDVMDSFKCITCEEGPTPQTDGVVAPEELVPELEPKEPTARPHTIRETMGQP